MKVNGQSFNTRSETLYLKKIFNVCLFYKNIWCQLISKISSTCPEFFIYRSPLLVSLYCEVFRNNDAGLAGLKDSKPSLIHRSMLPTNLSLQTQLGAIFSNLIVPIAPMSWFFFEIINLQCTEGTSEISHEIDS